MCIIGESKSKFEKIFVNKIAKWYPKLNIILNDKETLNGIELDIVIKNNDKIILGIEVNGTHHYKPIGYSKKSINTHKRTVKSDKNKKEMCKKMKIKLMTMDIHKVSLKDKRTLNMMADMIMNEIKERLN